MDALATQPVTTQDLIEHGWDAQLAALVSDNPRAAILFLVEHEGWDRLDAINRVLNPLAPFDHLVGRKRPPLSAEAQAIVDRALAELGIQLVGENGIRFDSSRDDDGRKSPSTTAV
jgi:hypothetical protein